MLRIFNSLGRTEMPFRPVRSGLVTIFTCGPSVYQPSHIGNFRTFLCEDILVRYLEYSGYRVRRGMSITDIEDKAIDEARRRGKSLKALTSSNLRGFVTGMRMLRMKRPDHLPRASETVAEAASIISLLLEKGIAYRHNGNIYFDPLMSTGFGELYGLDMATWPGRRRRFHKDTYPGMRWNRGDFILWHGCRDRSDYCRETAIGRGRPSWNIQDAAMVARHFNETLSFYCGGVDNLVRHHDYSKAIIESARPYPMARYWLHCEHLYVEGRKMSKSLGNILFGDDLLGRGYTAGEIRFFLIYGHYRQRLNYSEKAMESAAARLRRLRDMIAGIRRISRGLQKTVTPDRRLKEIFSSAMDDDLNVRKAVDGLHDYLRNTDAAALSPEKATGIIHALREIDGVLRVIF